MHDLLGTGVQAHFMSGAYMLFFAFIPATLAFALVFARNLQPGLFYVTAQSINWLLAAGSYFLLPSLGPVYLEPGDFADLPTTAISQLQDLLLDQRVEFLRDPRERRGAEHRRLLLAARVLLLHRRAGGASARTRAAAADRGVGPARPDDRGDDLPRLALRARRHRRCRDSARSRSSLARALTGLDLGTARRLAQSETAPS